MMDLTVVPTADLLIAQGLLRKYSPDQPRDEAGRFGEGGGTTGMDLTDAERESISGYPGARSRDGRELVPPDPSYKGEGYGDKRGADARMAQVAKDAELQANNWEWRASQGDTKGSIEGMEWSLKDGFYEPRSALIQSAAIETGLTSGTVWSNTPLLEPSAAARDAVTEAYDRTQKDLAKGPETYTLYRGIREDRATRNALESWSTDREFAARFDGGAVLEATVPRSAVFMDLRSGRGDYESEMVLLGGRIPSGSITVNPPERSRYGTVGTGFEAG